MRSLYFFIFIITAVSASAQPTLTSAWCPASGLQINQYTFYGNLGTISEGPAGASQTWDLTQYSASDSEVLSYVNPSTGMDASSFPAATDCESYGLYDYDQLVGNVYQIIGHIQPPPYHIVTTYTTPMTLLHFPVSFGMTLADTAVSSALETGSYPGTESGYYTIADTVDGYGTLITPAGTYTDVLRIKRVETDTFTNNGGGAIGYHRIMYKWFSPTVNGVILAYVEHSTVFSTGSSGPTTGDNGYYSELIPSGIGSLTVATTDWSIITQPASGHADLSITARTATTGSIAISDMDGRLISQQQVALTTGQNRVSLDLSGMADGIYMTKVSMNGQSSSKKLVVKQQ
jgi:hypothetical protein